ncbi:ribonuclease D [Amorphus orientalis]|uniref:Ribonuclease D n=1 Tax=Amorphus orientalis TaxID=649198 RepID=A0AAE4ASM3_9HYPH|nr:ribonuclease H-like domain-containing protein [Amorphus orientalis]MDQ0314114.1 ribonuclease D [Amorphus orientalis]
MTIRLHDQDLPEPLTAPSVAVDTETMGLNPVRDRLCLVQMSVGDGNAELVQIRQGQESAAHLTALMADPNVVKIFHYARFDMGTIYKTFGVMPAPVFCTKIASRLVRTYTDRHGLKDLARELAEVDISKQQQSSDWGADTLSDAQMAYAASDVLYLHRLKERLEVLLEREGRAEFAQACFEFLPTRVKLDLAGFAEDDLFAHS